MALNDKGIVLKSEEFSRFLREMRSELSRKATMQAVVDYEAAKVCEKALALTGKADSEKIKVKIKNKAVFNVDGKRYYTRNYKTGRDFKMPDAVWQEIPRIRAYALSTLLARIGLSKQSWYFLAQKLGVEIAAPAYVKNAKSVSNGGANNVSIERSGTGDKYGVTITNNMPILSYTPPGGREAFFSAMAGRINFFKNNLKKGVFDNIESISKKYKGILVYKNNV